MNLSPHQFDKHGQLSHLLSIEGLKRHHFLSLFEKAKSFFSENGEILQKDTLQNKTLINLFYEPSTRTRTTFDLAGKKLSANVVNINLSETSISKGESFIDTVCNLQAMQCDILVLRHPTAGAAHFIVQTLAHKMAVVNAGDGCHAHPSQALLDTFTLFDKGVDFPNISVAIIGDILHSRVARSQIQAFSILGTADIRVIAPPTLLPPFIEEWGVTPYHSLKEGLKAVDVIIVLRLQKERMEKGLIPDENAYYRSFGISRDILKIAKPNSLILHPGPINRGVEIGSEIIDSPNALMLKQVHNGIAMRMAILSQLMETRLTP